MWADATTVDLAPAIQQIGVGALIAVPAYVLSWLLWKRSDKASTECSELRAEQVMRERELSDRLGPLLAQSVDILSKAPDRFDRALSQANSSTRSTEVDALMRTLEQTVRRIQDNT